MTTELRDKEIVYDRAHDIGYIIALFMIHVAKDIEMKTIIKMEKGKMNKSVTNPLLNIRIAQTHELRWINTQYDKVGFKHSHFDGELVAIAEVNGEKAGLGRLQAVESSAAELGGIYVDEAYRGLGLAAEIVSFLVQQSHAYNSVFCLPFAHLSGFYKQFGFDSPQISTHVPDVVADKHRWCNQTYKSETLLFVLNHKG